MPAKDLPCKILHPFVAFLLQAEAKLPSSGLDNIAFAVGDLELVQFPNHAFDAILCSQAIFYFDMAHVPYRLHSWLKPGGLLAYNTLQVRTLHWHTFH